MRPRQRTTRGGTRAPAPARQPLEPVAGEHRPVLLVPGGHRRRAGPGARPADASADALDPHPRRSPSSRGRGRPRPRRVGRAARAPTWCRPRASRRRARPRARRTTGWRRGAPVRADRREPARRHVAERAPQELEVVAHPIATRSASARARRRPRGRARAASSAARASRDERVDAPGVAPCAASPSRRSSRSWNASPSGPPKPPSAAVGRRGRPGERGADQQRPLHGVDPALEPRDAARRSASSAARDVEELTARHLGAHPVVPGERSDRAARARTRRSSRSRSARTAARSPARSASDAPERSGSDARPRRRPRRQLRTRSRGRPAAPGRVHRSSWISAIVCSSSRAAAARTIGSPSAPARRAVAPVAEGRTSRLPPAMASRDAPRRSEQRVAAPTPAISLAARRQERVERRVDRARTPASSGGACTVGRPTWHQYRKAPPVAAGAIMSRARP